MGNYADNLDEKILKFLVETIVKTINMNILGGPYILLIQH